MIQSDLFGMVSSRDPFKGWIRDLQRSGIKWSRLESPGRYWPIGDFGVHRSEFWTTKFRNPDPTKKHRERFSSGAQWKIPEFYPSAKMSWSRKNAMNCQQNLVDCLLKIKSYIPSITFESISICVCFIERHYISCCFPKP